MRLLMKRHLDCSSATPRQGLWQEVWGGRVSFPGFPGWALCVHVAPRPLPQSRGPQTVGLGGEQRPTVRPPQMGPVTQGHLGTAHHLEGAGWASVREGTTAKA